MDSFTTCSMCSSIVRLQDEFNVHLCMAIICKSCLCHDKCVVCDHELVASTMTTVNAKLDCNFCEMEAIWKCDCHDVFFCSSCLLISHDNNFSGKSISKIIDNGQNETCSVCKTLKADYTADSCYVCIFCLPKQTNAKSFKRLSGFEPEKVHGLLNWIATLKKDSIRDYSKSIDIVERKMAKTDKEIEKAKAAIEDMKHYNKELIMDIKARDKIIKKLNKNTNFYEFLSFLISNNRINHDFLVKLSENIHDHRFQFTFFETNLKENLVDLDGNEMEQVQDSSLPKRAKHVNKVNYGNDLDAIDFNSISLFEFGDQNDYEVKIVYYRSPLYIICTIPGSLELRDMIMAKIRTMKFTKISNDQFQVGDIVIVSDAPVFGYPFKRARITRISGRNITVKQIDHGPVINVTIDKIYLCPSDLSKEPETVTRISLMNIAPKSKFAFIQPAQGLNAHDFMRDKLVPKDKIITIKRLYATTQTVYCKVSSFIQGQEIDWAKELIKAKPFYEFHGCFQPKLDFCYMFHVLTCEMGENCFRSHKCPYCDQKHALQNCQKFKCN